MKSSPSLSRNNRVEAPKRAGRKTQPHRATITKADNGGYSVEMQHRYENATDEYGDRPMSVNHAFANHKDMMDALPQMFGEAHPSTKPAKAQEGEEELPD